MDEVPNGRRHKPLLPLTCRLPSSSPSSSLDEPSFVGLSRPSSLHYHGPTRSPLAADSLNPRPRSRTSTAATRVRSPQAAIFVFKARKSSLLSFPRSKSLRPFRERLVGYVGSRVCPLSQFPSCRRRRCHRCARAPALRSPMKSWPSLPRSHLVYSKTVISATVILNSQL